jgi:molecular chaperone DnaK
MKYIGIDLGTTFSLAAVYNPDTKQVTVIPDEDAQGYTVPSVVYYPESGDPVVGQNAINAGEYAGDRLVRWIKMSMGDNFEVKVGSNKYSPPEVSAEILKKLKKNVETYFSISPEDRDKFWQDATVIITVPAYFEDRQNSDTLKAARLAGFDENNVHLFPEPCAAALAYVVEKEANLGEGVWRVLVSDLGGGTYDATIIETKPFSAPDGRTHLDIAIICKDGSRELGGVLWDDRLMEYVIARCASDVAGGHSPIDTQDPSAAHTLREKVIRTKELLSTQDPVMISCCPGKSQKISREEFVSDTASLLMEVETKLRAVLDEDRRLQQSRGTEVLGLNKVLLAGSSSNMPQVEDLIKDVTGLEPLTHKGLGQIVAIGAAYEAAIKARKDGDQVGVEVVAPGGIVIKPPTSVLGVNVGVMARNPSRNRYENVVVLEKGTKEGVEKSRKDLVTEEENQPAIRFVLLQGEDGSDAADCVELGEAVLALPPGQPKWTKVEVLLKLGETLTIVGRGICYTTEGPRECPIEIKREGITVPE